MIGAKLLCGMVDNGGKEMTIRVAAVLGLALTVNLITSALSMAAEESGLATEEGILGSITIGSESVDVDNTSFKYGEYNGVNKDGSYFLGNADLNYNKEAYYLDFRAEGIGLDSRDIYLESGRYGRFRLYLEDSELPHYISNSNSTPFANAGNENLTLPSGFVRGFQTQDMTTLNSSLQSTDLKLKRYANSAGFAMALGKNIDFNMSVKREEKDGEKSIGGTIGAIKANSRSVVLPEPVDYTTDEFRARIAYTGENAQAELGYFLSTFNNNIKYISWENPFDVVDDPSTARISLSPDNRYQKLSLSGAANLPYSTRISAIAEYGKMEQGETLLPYSNNPGTIITAALPRENADTEIDTTHLSLNLSSKPVPRLGLNVRYRYYKTENKMPVDLFQYVRNDTGGASQATVNNSWALYNLPYDYTENQIRFDASCGFMKGSSFKIGFDHDAMERSYREVKETKEDTYKAGLIVRPQPDAYASLDYSHSSRKIDDEYDESRVFDSRHTDGYINSISNPDLRFDNNPYLRMYDIADRDRNKYSAKLSYSGMQNSSIGLTYSYWKDDYTDSPLGLTQSTNNTSTVDASISPVESIILTAFYTRENLTSMQTGRDFITSIPSEYQDANRDWKADHRTGINMAGVGAGFGLLKDKLTITADYSYSESEESINFTTGSSLTSPVDMPDLTTKLHKVKVSGKYNINTNLSAGLGYEYEEYNSKNWATDNVAPASTSMADALTLSGSTPDYKVHTGMIYLTYNFGS